MKKILSVTFSLFLTIAMFAQDRQFLYTYQSLTLPKGAKDIEVWNTYRTGRQYLYNRLDQRIEFEVGVTDKLQTALYFNAEHKMSQTHLDTLGGIPDTTFYGLYSESAFSFSSEWKLRLSDPVANRIGSALYAELTVGAAEIELEGKLILDKKTDKNIFAMNLVGEYEIEFEAEPAKSEIETEYEFKPEVDLAYMRMLKPNLGLGLEARYNGVIVKGDVEHSAIFGGPSLFYGGDKFFIILSASPQLSNLQVNDQNPKSFDMTEYEKYQFRLLLGLSF
jgi:hypothetical protein